MYKLLKDSLKIRRYLLVTILVIQFISVILSTLLPYMNGMFVDMLIDIKNVEEVIKYAITIAGVGIISLFLSYIYNLKIMKVTGIFDFSSGCSKIFYFPRRVKQRKASHRKRSRFAGFRKKQGLFIWKEWDSSMGKRQIGFCFLMKSQPSW